MIDPPCDNCDCPHNIWRVDCVVCGKSMCQKCGEAWTRWPWFDPHHYGMNALYVHKEVCPKAFRELKEELDTIWWQSIEQAKDAVRHFKSGSLT